jgi:hypothetical protein
MSRLIRVVCLSGVLTPFVSTPVLAQDAPLSGLLVDLLIRSVVMPSTVENVPGNPHEAHFLPGFAQTAAPFELNKALVTQLSTFPIGSSSGGFTYTFDSRSRAFSRSSESFGPSFAERALTNGRRRFSAGVNVQRTVYEDFEGVDLRPDNFDGILFYLQHNDCCPGQNPTTGAPGGGGGPVNPAFEGDLIQVALSLRAESTTTALFMTYGVTDRFDVGVTFPIVRVKLEAATRSTVERLSTAANPLIHSWDGRGATVKTESVSGSATGLGDILVRSKYNFWRTATGGVSAGVDLRLPTGDKDDLLGTGATQVKLQFIASGGSARVQPHVNVGYTFSSGEVSAELNDLRPPADLPGSVAFYQNVYPPGFRPYEANLEVPDELSWTLGAEWAAHPRLTIAGDIVGRSLRDVQRFTKAAQAFQYRTANDGPLLSTDRTAFNIDTVGTLNLALGVVSAKFNVPNTQLLITGSVLFPLTDAGLRPGITPVIGIDYGFGR